MHAIRRFIEAEPGAIGVDWVVLTATLAGLGVFLAMLLGSGFQSGATELQVSLARAQTACEGFCARQAAPDPAEAVGP